ncbi:MAG: hypothetical protein WCE68_15840 [Anaerolineales bacterium]
MKTSNEDDLRDVLDKTAQEISRMYSNPSTWQTWMVYLLERLEAQAIADSAHMDSFKEMLSSLQEELKNRLKTGGW